MQLKRDELIHSLTHSMASLSRFVLGRVQCAAPDGTPTHAQLGVLFVLKNHGTQSVKEIASRFGISSSATTQLINAMVSEGLLERTVDKEDRRSTRIGLSKKGERKFEKAKTSRLKLIGKIFEPLSDQELVQFSKLHQKMSDYLKQHE